MLSQVASLALTLKYRNALLEQLRSVCPNIGNIQDVNKTHIDQYLATFN